MPPQQMAGGVKAPVNRNRTPSEAPSQGGGKKPSTIAPGNKYTWAEVFRFSEEGQWHVAQRAQLSSVN